MLLLVVHVSENHRTETLYNKPCVPLNYTKFTRNYQKEFIMHFAGLISNLAGKKKWLRLMVGSGIR